MPDPNSRRSEALREQTRWALRNIAAILEAIVNGLPVVTTAACGYAAHVDASQGGLVLPQPFRQTMFVSALRQARDEGLRRTWSRSAEEYGRNSLFYHGRDQIAADFVRLAQEKKQKAEK